MTLLQLYMSVLTRITSLILSLIDISTTAGTIYVHAGTGLCSLLVAWQ